MSRSRTRARKRRARFEGTQAEFVRAREDPGSFADLLTRLSASDVPVWPLAHAAAAAKPLEDAERAMIAQAVAPHLAGITPGSVKRRLIHGRLSQSHSIRPSG